MRSNKDKENSKLLNCGDALELSKFKKRIKIQKAGKPSRSVNSDPLFDNLISVEELAVIFRTAPQTIRNWVARGKIPYIQVGRRYLFQRSSLQQWLNRKETPQWR